MDIVKCYFLDRRNLQGVERQHVHSPEDKCAIVPHLHPSHMQYWLVLSSDSCSALLLNQQSQGKTEQFF